MTHFRFIPLAAVLTSAVLLAACNTAPTTPMGASASSMATPDHMARMDTQMKTMQAMHDRMINAKTPQERSKLMAEHMKAMQDGMSSAGMGDMKGMPGMTGDMGAHHQMMAKRMEMMQMMMQMMMDRQSADMPMAK
ncbi:hypothetical protein SBP18_01975 [Rhodoferax ferrireducens]|uniref:hypothetical protein n=1 Tax=Rhodoferax ferrireducens TaxID=192843 RepID=UPI00298E1649|nr:hypothetical protein [Rhodoferax ferrireducens]WPC67294.1 hypothetical protein SBP18_01975 [Rhodoferax ferrireducens]